MIVFRLCRQPFELDLSGAGARKHGGRWNSKGIPVLYTGETRALCATEIAVHSPFGVIPINHVMVSIFVPDSIKIKTLAVKDLPDDWNHFPHMDTTQKIGDSFIKQATHLVLKVPSATIQGEHNFLINPLHADIKKIKIEHFESFNFDSRLFIKK